ncbi:copper resistance CopC/CopD family protein [Bacillus smithii]|uniref:copper resistance CopC/CopD family protein n=1 Tax=Bacillus smithii TaxID=1479 RepID=UPI003D20DD31
MKSIKIGLAIFIIFMLCVFHPSLSQAHAYIIQSSPSENEVLDKGPANVKITFNEAVQPVFHSLKVLDEKGKRVDRGDGHVEKKHPSILTASLKKNLPKGTYVIRWKVISGDGHPVEGTIPFRIGDGSQSNAPLANETKGYFPKADMILIRWLQYVSYALLIGVIFFQLCILPPQKNSLESFLSRRNLLVWISAVGITVSILLSLPLQAKLAADVSWLNAFQFSYVKNTLFYTNFGPVFLAQWILLIFLYLFLIKALRHDRSGWLIASWMVGFGLLLTKAFIGHAATAEHRLLALMADFLHLAAASIWLGSLLSICFLLPSSLSQQDQEDHKSSYWKAIHRFSVWGMVISAIILATGLYSGSIHVPNWHSVISTTYGRFFLAKVFLFVVMMAFAAYHWVRGRKKEKILGRTVWIEFSVGILTLAVAAILANMPTAFEANGAFHETKKTENGYVVSLKVDPADVGKNSFYINIVNNQGKSVQGLQQVVMTLNSLDMDMGNTTIQVPTKSMGSGYVTGTIPMEGDWKIHIHGLTQSFDSIDADFQLYISDKK